MGTDTAPRRTESVLVKIAPFSRPVVNEVTLLPRPTGTGQAEKHRHECRFRRRKASPRRNSPVPVAALPSLLGQPKKG